MAEGRLTCGSLFKDPSYDSNVGSLWILGGSWVVISGVIIKATLVITHIRGRITILITTHEPPSTRLDISEIHDRDQALVQSLLLLGHPFKARPRNSKTSNPKP